jgi:beta-glucosidase
VQQVRNADVTVAVVGEHPWRSGEANSVTDIGLPAGQLDYVRQLARIGKPLVVVVYTGRPLELGEVLDLADAVLVVWHPGVEAGPALADVVFGDVSPHGRLPMTFPRTTGHNPTSTHQRPTGRVITLDQDDRQGRYLDDRVFPRLPFGHGLAYTTFDSGALRTRGPGELAVDGELVVEVDVTNTGDRAGREVVQLSFRDPVAQVTRPLTELVDWVALDLEPGEKGTATFTVRSDQLAYYGRDNVLRVDPGEIVLSTGPDSARLQSVSVTVRSGS